MDGGVDDGDSAQEGEALESMTPYVAQCHEHQGALRKRKRQQQEQMEQLVQGKHYIIESCMELKLNDRRMHSIGAFVQIEEVINGIMTHIQAQHTASQEQFMHVDTALTQGLQVHNRVMFGDFVQATINASCLISCGCPADREAAQDDCRHFAWRA